MRLLSIAVFGAFLLVFHDAGFAQSTPIVLSCVQDLRTIDTATASFTNPATSNYQVAYVSDYYKYGSVTATQNLEGRAGGHFRWYPRGRATWQDDGGRWITNIFTHGVWERMLDGEIPNVRMWGAVGDGKVNDTIAISNAIFAAENWNCGELIFPAGVYLITDTLIFDAHNLHIHGEGNAEVLMATNAQKDIFRTDNANNALTGKFFPDGFDNGLLFEDLILQFQEIRDAHKNVLWHNSKNSALVLCEPGEVSTVRHITTEDGGFGIRCLGGGAPGLRVQDVQVDGAAIAGISIEPVPGFSYVFGDPDSLIGVSGDMRYADCESNACLIRYVNSLRAAEIANVKAEGDFGGGVIQYIYAPASEGLGGRVVGALYIHNSSYLADHTNTQFVTLKGDTRSAMVTLQNVGQNGSAILIKDMVVNNTVPATLLNGFRPIIYDSFKGRNMGYPAAKLVVGQTMFSSFLPTRSGWYRVMQAPQNANGRLSGRVSWYVPSCGPVSSIGQDNTEMEVDADPNGKTTADPYMNVLRKKRESGRPPLITKARALDYFDTAGDFNSYVDFYVSTNDNPGPVTIALDLNQVVEPNYDTAQLVWPVIFLGNTNLASTIRGTLNHAATNSTYR